MPRQMHLDRFGRIVIPKPTRERFGLEPGSALRVDERDDGILLQPAEAEPPLRLKGAVLVFQGAALADAEDRLARQRDERIRRLMPRLGRSRR